MGWFDNQSSSDSYSNGSRWRSSYDYVRQSPTVFTAIMTLIWAVSAVLSKTESIGTVAAPTITALLFLAHNVHARKAHREVSDALEEARTTREEIDRTRQDLRQNTDHTLSAAESADAAARSVARVEKLTEALNAKFDALHGKEKS